MACHKCFDHVAEIKRLRRKISLAINEDNSNIRLNILMEAINPKEYELLTSMQKRHDITSDCDGSCNSAPGVCDCAEIEAGRGG